MDKKIIGLAGEISSGKGTITKYIKEKYNGKTHRFSTMLRDILDRLYLEQSRDNIQKLSTTLRENYGQDLFSKVLARDVEKDSAGIIVVDGVRRESDIKYLKQDENFKLIFVKADMKKRYERIIKRGENTDDSQKTFEDFKEEHNDESELQIRGLENIADAVIDNSGDLENLYKQVDEVLK